MARRYRKKGKNREINWKLPNDNPNYPKNWKNYKTTKCNKPENCIYNMSDQCLFYHNDMERDYWNTIREIAYDNRKFPAEVDSDVKKVNKQIKLNEKMQQEFEELPPNIKKTLELSGAFEGGRKKRKSLFLKKRTKKGKKRRRKRTTKKRKSRKRRRTKRKKK